MTVYLCCVSGFSSSIMARNLEIWLQERMEEEVLVEPASYRMMKDEGALADIILRSPQMAWARQKLSGLIAPVPVLTVGIQAYGLGQPDEIGREILGLAAAGL